MKVLFREPKILPVARYGGTERMIFWMMKELVKQGHQVVLIGHPESRVREFGIELIPSEEGLVDWSSLVPQGVDVAHLFEPVPFSLPLPHLVTIGGNGQPGETFPLNTVFVSRKHAGNHSSSSFVYNGLDFDEYPYFESPPLGWDSFLFLAKASWRVKNLKGCVRACKSAKKHLHVGGGRAWTLSPYVHSYGMVDQIQKHELFKRVNALLFPIRWQEPFGIAIIEAMAMGLPVIGSKYGSLPEIITPEVGLLCEDSEALDRAVSSDYSGRFDPLKIREITQERFDISVIARRYLELYEIVAGGGSLNDEPPRSTFSQRPEDLLPF